MAAFSMKKHTDAAGRSVIAVSDSDLLNRELKDTEKDIEFFVSPSFYGEETFSEEEVFAEITEADNVNLIGNGIVDAAVNKHIVNEGSVTTIAGIKHAQVYKI